MHFNCMAIALIRPCVLIIWGKMVTVVLINVNVVGIDVDADVDVGVDVDVDAGYVDVGCVMEC